MTEQPHNEFLPGPAWRLRAGPRRRALAIAATFSLILLAGAGTFWLIFAVLRELEAPTWAALGAWLLPTAAVTIWALQSRVPATVSDVESQGWSEYVVRYVMVGNETPRAVPLRVITGIVFGAPIACYAVFITVLALAGIA